MSAAESNLSGAEIFPRLSRRAAKTVVNLCRGGGERGGAQALGIRSAVAAAFLRQVRSQHGASGAAALLGKSDEMVSRQAEPPAATRSANGSSGGDDRIGRIGAREAAGGGESRDWVTGTARPTPAGERRRREAPPPRRFGADANDH